VTGLPDRLQQLIDTADQATPGPWTAEAKRAFVVTDEKGKATEYEAFILAADENGTASLLLALEGRPDAAFIAAADPNVVKALAEAVQAAAALLRHIPPAEQAWLIVQHGDPPLYEALARVDAALEKEAQP
jgi:hypothetical protein